MSQEKIKQVFAFVFPDRHLNRSLRILVVSNSIFVFIMGLFAPYYAVFIQNIGGSIAFAGFAWAIFSIVAGVLILLFSSWELKIKEPELLLALGYLLRGGVFISYAFMTSLPQLIVTQVIWGVAVALGTPAFDSLYASHTDKEASIAQWGGWEGIAAIMTGAGALIGGLVIQSFGYGAVFIGMALISFGLGVYIWKQPRDLL